MKQQANTIDSTAPGTVSVRHLNDNNCLRNACKLTRPILADSITYINFVARQYRHEGMPEVCREARLVLTRSLAQAIRTLDEALAGI